MSFIGNVPAEAYSPVAKDTFSGDDSTTDFTLSIPATTNGVEVLVENVQQEPTTAYTISGTTLSFTAAPTTGTNNIYVIHRGPAVQTVVPPGDSITTAMIQDEAVTAAKLFSGFANGVTEADQWRITADTTATVGNTDITANWERVDTEFEKIGSGMTESSGIFTFPSTGKWLIFGTTYSIADGSAAVYIGHKIAVSTNGGSSYSNRALGYGSAYATSAYQHVHTNLFLDVTSTTNFKVKMIAEVSAQADIIGQTDQNRTSITFIRLGDT